MQCKSGPRRRHSDEFKAKVLAACKEPGVSIAGVALAHGLNTNLVRKWRSGRGCRLAGTTLGLGAASAARLGAPPEFVAIEMPPLAKVAQARTAPQAGTVSMSEPLIRIELRRGPLTLNVCWPSAAAEGCRAWLHELSSGLLK